MQISYSTIFWDWNGTLLDDAVVCVEAMNMMLGKRGKQHIDNDYYKSVFGFPVIEYYKKLGFNPSLEPFETLSHEFITNYSNCIHLAKLQPHSADILNHFRSIGKQQIVISAMEQNMLNRQLADYCLLEYFDEVRGTSNIFANGKNYLARNCILENKINSQQVLFIGDTLHDKEVADEIGAESILVSNGHQSAARLAINGNKVINDLKSLLSFN
jgi:phosphoglycolate phosphatase